MSRAVSHMTKFVIYSGLSYLYLQKNSHLYVPIMFRLSIVYLESRNKCYQSYNVTLEQSIECENVCFMSKYIGRVPLSNFILYFNKKSILFLQY